MEAVPPQAESPSETVNAAPWVQPVGDTEAEEPAKLGPHPGPTETMT